MTISNHITKQCKKCGQEKPATTEYFKFRKTNRDKLCNICKECESIKAKERRKDPEFIKREREYRRVNKERRAAQHRQYYLEHREQAIEQARQWRHDNRDHYNEWERHYRKQDHIRKSIRNHNRIRNQDPVRRAKMREYGRTAYYRNLDKNRERARLEMRERRKDPVLGEIIRERDRLRHKTLQRQLSHKVYNNRRRARKQNSITVLTPEQWQRCLEYFDYRCAVCGRPRGLWHTIAQEHWLALSNGGYDVVGNILPMCHSLKGGTNSCNNTKSNRDAETWLVERAGEKDAKTILSRILAYFEWVKEGA